MALPRRNKNASAKPRRKPIRSRAGIKAGASPAPRPRVDPVELLHAELVRLDLAPEREHKFHPKRRWRFDFAWPKAKVAAEVEGGIFIRGRHVRPSGFIKDCEKYNTAAEMGWLVLRFPVTGKGWQLAAGALVERIVAGRYLDYLEGRV